MDINKNLIMVKNKNGEFEDKTKGIKWIKYENGKQNITYTNGKTYPHNYSNVKCYKDPRNRLQI